LTREANTNELTQEESIAQQDSADSPANPIGRRSRKGIFIFPTLLTLGNIYFGYLAVMTVFKHYGQATFPDMLVRGCYYLIFAAFLDMIDGKVARLTHTTSEFGIQLDSLADVLSFGLAPGFLAYAWALGPQQRLGWLPPFLFLICGVIRLARFNVQTKKMDKRFFTGLPIPAAAMTVVTLMLLFPDWKFTRPESLGVALLLVLLSFLMVSRIRYRSFKEIDFRAQRPIRTILLIGLILTTIMYHHRLMLFLIAITYVSSALVSRLTERPAMWFKTLYHRITAPIAEMDEDEDPAKNSESVIEQTEQERQAKE